jgi:hypothetical protein
VRELAGQLVSEAEREQALDWLLKQSIRLTKEPREIITVMKWCKGDPNKFVSTSPAGLANFLALYLKDHQPPEHVTGRKFKED